MNPKGSKKKEGKKCSLYRILKIMVQNKRYTYSKDILVIILK